ncbi:MAG: regulatory protein RecX [Bacillota bacterium]
MVITKIEQQKNSTNRYNIYIDDEFCLSMDIGLIYELKLKAGSEVDIKALNEIIDRNEESKAFNYCLRLLGKIGKTETEIRKKLTEKGYKSEAIDRTVEKLIGLDYINDERYTDAWLRQRQNSNLSRKIMFMKLLQKGIDKDTIKAAIENISPDEYAAASRQAEKKLKTLKGEDKNTKRKLFAFLYGKGYNLDICRRVISNLFDDEGL